MFDGLSKSGVKYGAVKACELSKVTGCYVLLSPDLGVPPNPIFFANCERFSEYKGATIG
ncbi:protein of unknown function [Pseudorhizobium banfieldiae]|uniref:Uncharacterized protein n=1 Tax=Pseudorhizobium banfieldiae TaxID=1125847 RepID=L0NJL4_9HYPH|nr:protein of unknown function [Pseudorhizobium banfieldiae]